MSNARARAWPDIRKPASPYVGWRTTVWGIVEGWGRGGMGEFARRLGVTPRYVRMLRSGRRPWTVRLVGRVLVVLWPLTFEQLFQPPESGAQQDDEERAEDAGAETESIADQQAE